MVRSLTIALCLLLGATAAFAQDWPQRPVRLIVPYAAGGGTDIVARVLAQKLGDALGQPFLVENRTGASGMIGAQMVAKSDADGYTFLVASPAEIALNQNLFPTIAYDPLRDFAPITLLAWTPMVLAAHPSFPASTVPELIALARGKPTDFSSPGVGSAHHLVGEYINALAGTHLMHVPYRGAAPALTDLLGGQVEVLVADMPVLIAQIQAGSLVPLGVASDKRDAVLPDVPTFAEQGYPNTNASNWYALLAPAKTPPAVVAKLNKAVNDALNDPEVHDKLVKTGATPVGGTPESLGTFMKAEYDKWGRVVQENNIKETP